MSREDRATVRRNGSEKKSKDRVVKGLHRAEASREQTPAKPGVRQRRAYSMYVTAAVFHLEISLLNDDAS